MRDLETRKHAHVQSIEDRQCLYMGVSVTKSERTLLLIDSSSCIRKLVLFYIYFYMFFALFCFLQYAIPLVSTSQGPDVPAS